MQVRGREAEKRCGKQEMRRVKRRGRRKQDRKTTGKVKKEKKIREERNMRKGRESEKRKTTKYNTALALES